MSSTNKHWCTLRPETEEDRQKFWDFRVEDIAEMFGYYAVTTGLFWLIQLTLFIIAEPEDRGDILISVILESLSFVTTSIVWVMISSRFKKHVIPLLIMLAILSVIFHGLNFDSLMKKAPDSSSLEFATHVVRFKIFLYCILLAPALAIVIAYQLIYCLTIVTVIVLE